LLYLEAGDPMSYLNIKIYGIVQGVGFRPFVSRLADECGILGTVCNKGPYVEIFAQGTPVALENFIHGLHHRAPERSTILKIDVAELHEDASFSRFDIVESAKEQGDIFVSPDIATCEKCRKELFDPQNRRYLHPFINCTACGPRLTILDAMPYDRERTSMGEFPMCEACHEEYTSPESRRYDAQPVCCNDCGPEVYIIDSTQRGADAIRRTRRTIADGGIVAIKGIGGFHLCCDATNEDAVRRLRRLKHRPVKPFAVMLRDMDSIRQECFVEQGQEEFLDGHQKPILLLKRRPKGSIAPSVAPGNPKIGVMLPYAPVQLLLFDYPDGLSMPHALVMTSGNPSGAPICHTDDEAREALGGMCDCILSHNRRIRLRADDSVMDWMDGKPYMIRRSRGFAPLPFMLGEDFKGKVLAIGGELKNTFCLASNHLFYPSPYIGDMTDLRTVLALKDSVQLMESLLENRPSIVACDLHPRYNTTTVAEEAGLPLFPVQHHYAHILSCMAENDHPGPVIGISFDGTGYGGDGTIWGGEILRADYEGYARPGSIQPFCQAGGDKASREGWRIAVSLIYEQCGRNKEKTGNIVRKLDLCTPEELSAQFFLLDNQINCITSTSAGRLFDAVSAILGIRKASTFEGEASMYLEFAAEEWEDAQDEPQKEACSGIHDLQESSLQTAGDGRLLLPTLPLFRCLLQSYLEGQSKERLAYLFHDRLAGQVQRACSHLRDTEHLSVVALSGGVFQNHLLTRLTKEKLTKDGFTVLLHSLIPPNDGGICLGQAVAAMHHIRTAPKAADISPSAGQDAAPYSSQSGDTSP